MLRRILFFVVALALSRAEQSSAQVVPSRDDSGSISRETKMGAQEVYQALYVSPDAMHAKTRELVREIRRTALLIGQLGTDHAEQRRDALTAIDSHHAHLILLIDQLNIEVGADTQQLQKLSEVRSNLDSLVSRLHDANGFPLVERDAALQAELAELAADAHNDRGLSPMAVGRTDSTSEDETVTPSGAAH